MTNDQPEGGDVQPQVMIDPGQMAGVWANFARISHSPYEFTLDFVRLDFASQPPQGIVVARVSVSPLFITQLIDTLSANWANYAEKSMPAEVRHGAAAAGPEAEDDSADPPA